MAVSIKSAREIEMMREAGRLLAEVHEELGIDISNQNIALFDSGCDGKECYNMYYVNIDIDINELVIQEELTEVKWFNINTLK